MSFISKVITAPTFRFLIVGAALFALSSTLHNEQISVSQSYIKSLQQRGKTAQDYVEEEVLLREAIRNGAHYADPVVRTRLAQDMRLMVRAQARRNGQDPKQALDELIGEYDVLIEGE